MNLEQLIAQHVHKWPEGAEYIEQNGGGMLLAMSWGGAECVHSYGHQPLCDDWQTAAMSKDTWCAQERAKQPRIVTRVAPSARQLGECDHCGTPQGGYRAAWLAVLQALDETRPDWMLGGGSQTIVARVVGAIKNGK